MKNGNPKNATTAEEAAVEAVYDEILSRVVFGVACGVHRAAKTGALFRSAVILGRRSGAEEEEDAAEDDCAGTVAAGKGPGTGDKITNVAAAEVAKEAVAGNVRDGYPAKRSEATSSDGREAFHDRENPEGGGEGTAVCKAGRDGEGARKRKPGDVPPSALATKPALCAVVPGSRAASPKAQRTDIYGRTPGKDAPYPVPCPNGCGRQITSSRMALHLEKCLGLSARRRGPGGSAAVGGTCRKGGGSSSAGTPSGGRGRGGAGKSDRGGAGRGGKGGKFGRQGKQAKRKSSKIV